MTTRMIDEAITELTAITYRRDAKFVHLGPGHRELLALALFYVLDESKLKHSLLKSRSAADRRWRAARFDYGQSKEMIANVHARVFTSFMELSGPCEPPTSDMQALSRFVLDLVRLLAQRGAIAVRPDPSAACGNGMVEPTTNVIVFKGAPIQFNP